MSFQIAKNLIVFSFLFLFSQIIFAQTPTDLELNKPIEREIKANEKYLYRINLAENQYAKITIEQEGVDVRGRLLDAKNKPLDSADLNNTIKGFEVVECVANKPDVFFIEVSKADFRLSGKFQIQLGELRTATKKEAFLDEARRLVFQAAGLWRNDKYDEALVLANRALEIAERELGAEDSFIGTVLFWIANQYNYKGDYAKAEQLFLRAMIIKEKALGKDNAYIATILNEFGHLYKEKGDYIKAESVYLHALEIRQKLLEPNHLSTAIIYSSLGSMSLAKGDIKKASEYYQRCLEIREKALSPDDPRIADILMNTANLRDDLEKSIALYSRALAIREKIFGKDSPEIGQVLYNMATVYVAFGNYAKAEDYGKRSLENLEKALGAEHQTVSLPLNLLGVVYANSGKYAEAETVYLRAITIKEKNQGVFHPEVGGTISNLANVYALKGEVEKAVATQKRANEIVELNISVNLGTGSEREKSAYLQTINPVYLRSLTLAFQYAPNSKSAGDLAAEIVLRQKGRVLDVISDQMSVLRSRFDEKGRTLLDKLDEKNKRISELILNGAGDALLTEYKTKINLLNDEREKLEGEISRLASAFFEKSKPVEIAEIQTQIPNNTTLLEFAVYKPVEFKESENKEASKSIKSHYAVFVLQNNGAVKSKDLGEANPIDVAIAKFREALQEPKRTDIKQLARDLDKKVMSPIREFLGDSRQLLISPDGNLNLIPFEALVDENGKYLVEKYSISYLSSGRDLLRMQNSKPNNNSPLIIANPDFGIAETTAKVENQTVAKRDKKRGVTVAKSLSETYFAPLSGTEQEGKTIQTLFPESTLLTGTKATKDALKQTKSPSILHIATHGFYLEDKEKTDSENPLLRSGIALAGANAHKENNGILTALESSGLNLFGTKLVVLSACGTGLGEVQSGEGVFGLRRSFVLAGSESLVISLWSVSDYVTRELMTNYYKNLKQGIGRGESLRKVQLEMLKNPKRNHPFYWASFIESGNWTSL